PSSPPRLNDDISTDPSITTALMSSAKRDQVYCRLMLISGPSAGQILPLREDRKRFVIGRFRGADVHIDDPGVSRLHCRIVRGEGSLLFLQDLSSRNGSFVNGQRVVCMPLHAGDRIQLGPNVMLQVGLFDHVETALATSLYEASTRDPLTRLANRRYFEQRIV